MNPGDTLGVYISLQNSAARLSYRNPGSPVTRSTPELTMLTGSGASFNFGGNFYPRDWNGTVYYHFGTKPEADCQSPRLPVEALISSVAADLGPDTILPLNGSIFLSPGGGYSTYQWSTGDTGPGILLDGNQLGQGIYVVSVTVTDSAGCTGTDEVIVVFAPLAGLAGTADESLQVWPVPAAERVMVRLPASGVNASWSISLVDLHGRTVQSRQVVCGNHCEIEMDLRSIPSGIYMLEARDGDRLLHGKVIK
jgi:hypothetical protein